MDFFSPPENRPMLFLQHPTAARLAEGHFLATADLVRNRFNKGALPDGDASPEPTIVA